MGAINLAGVMDALAARLVTADVTERAYAWPADNVQPPCAVIGYPEDIEFDATFGRGSDVAVFPVWFLVGKVSERTARDRLSAIVTGATGIKNALDGGYPSYIQTARVQNCRPAPVTVAGVEYLAARFDVEVYS
jgi:hypothetical protein